MTSIDVGNQDTGTALSNPTASALRLTGIPPSVYIAFGGVKEHLIEYGKVELDPDSSIGDNPEQTYRQRTCVLTIPARVLVNDDGTFGMLNRAAREEIIRTIIEPALPIRGGGRAHETLNALFTQIRRTIIESALPITLSDGTRNWPHETRNALFNQIEDYARQLFTQQGGRVVPDPQSEDSNSSPGQMGGSGQTDRPAVIADSWRSSRMCPLSWKLKLYESSDPFPVWVRSLTGEDIQYEVDVSYSGAFTLVKSPGPPPAEDDPDWPRIRSAPGNPELLIEYRTSNKVVKVSDGLIVNNNRAHGSRRKVTPERMASLPEFLLDELMHPDNSWLRATLGTLLTVHHQRQRDRIAGRHTEVEFCRTEVDFRWPDSATWKKYCDRHKSIRSSMYNALRFAHERHIKYDPRTDIVADDRRTGSNARLSFEPVSCVRNVDTSVFGNSITRLRVTVVPLPTASSSGSTRQAVEHDCLTG